LGAKWREQWAGGCPPARHATTICAPEEIGLEEHKWRKEKGSTQRIYAETSGEGGCGDLDAWDADGGSARLSAHS
jgi:hypothetical protein